MVVHLTTLLGDFNVPGSYRETLRAGGGLMNEIPSCESRTLLNLVERAFWRREKVSIFHGCLGAQLSLSFERIGIIRNRIRSLQK